MHESVLDRIRGGTDHYAPIGLPSDFDVLGRDGRITTIRQPDRAARQEWVWNDVWRRRVNYFLILGLSLLLAALPAIQSYWPPSACLGPQCILSPLLTGAGMFLPGFLKPWLEAFARMPGTAAGLLIALMLLLGRSGFLERRIRDAMRELWLQSLGIPLPSGTPRTWAGQTARGAWGFVYWLRTSRAYQRTFQYLKWWIGPAAFGITLLVGGLLVCLALLLIIVGRLDLVRKEADGSICELGANQATEGPGQFSTRQLCWRLGQQVRKGLRYRMNITVAQRWRDQDVGTDPQGFGNDRMPAPAKFGAYLVRRSAADRWFQPVLRITRVRGEQSRLQPLEFRCRCGGGASAAGAVTYTAEFTAEQDGEVSLFINDAVIAVPGFSKVQFGVTPEFYENNEGRATVEISPVDNAP